MKLPILTIACAAMAVSGAVAQERSAAGSLETQMTWSALKTLVDAANSKSDAVNTRVDQIVLCGKKGKVYAPGHTGADSDGCVVATVSTVPSSVTNQITNLQTTISNQLTCAQQGLLFNGWSCVNAVNNFKISSVAAYGSGDYVSTYNPTTTSGWHTLCISAFHHNDSNTWLNVVNGPNEYGKRVWQAINTLEKVEPRILCFD